MVERAEKEHLDTLRDDIGRMRGSGKTWEDIAEEYGGNVSKALLWKVCETNHVPTKNTIDCVMGIADDEKYERLLVENYDKEDKWVAAFAAMHLVGKYKRGRTKRIAGKLMVSISQVERLARAARTRKNLHKHGMRHGSVDGLSITHFHVMGRLMIRFLILPEDAIKILNESALNNYSAAQMEGEAKRIYNDNERWYDWWDDIVECATLIVEDNDAPLWAIMSANKIIYIDGENYCDEIRTTNVAHEYEDLPEENKYNGWVYYIFHGDELLYIGQTENLKQRLNSHPIYIRGVHTVKYSACRESRLMAEEKAIKLYRPPLNGSNESQNKYKRWLRKTNGKKLHELFL